MLEVLWKKKITQIELAILARISSEARLSRIIHGTVTVSNEEVLRISKVLNEDPATLGLIAANANSLNR